MGSGGGGSSSATPAAAAANSAAATVVATPKSNVFQQKTSATFEAFRKAAQEKQESERKLKEQQVKMKI